MAEIEGALTLLDGLSSKDKRTCLELLVKVFGNIVKHPHDPKYRLLKLSNRTFNDAVWRHAGGRAIMEAAGWEVLEERVELPTFVDPTICLNVLLSNRDVKPNATEWVEETKVVVPNPAKAREEELREKALKEKHKEMAEMKKDMAMKKEIAERIREEHRADRESKLQKQFYKASKAEF